MRVQEGPGEADSKWVRSEAGGGPRLEGCSTGRHKKEGVCIFSTWGVTGKVYL